jgi:hypothetical protein
MVEEHIQLKVLIANGHAFLAGDERKVGAQLQQKPLR